MVTAAGRTCRKCTRLLTSSFVPTTAQFTEGFNQVMTEAVLSGRPVVTSDACPAVEYLPNTGVLVPTDDTMPMRRPSCQLCDGPGVLRKSARANCATVSGPFYDTGERLAGICGGIIGASQRHH